MKKNLLPSTMFEKFLNQFSHCSSCNNCVDAVCTERDIHHVHTTMEYFSRNPSYSGRGFIAAVRARADRIELDLDGLAKRVTACAGCVPYKNGKTWGNRSGYFPEFQRLLEMVKKGIDPQNIMSPANLGL